MSSQSTTLWGRDLETIVVSPSDTIGIRLGDAAGATIATIPETIMITTELEVEPATELFGVVSISGTFETTFSLSTLIRQDSSTTDFASPTSDVSSASAVGSMPNLAALSDTPITTDLMVINTSDLVSGLNPSATAMYASSATDIKASMSFTITPVISRLDITTVHSTLDDPGQLSVMTLTRTVEQSSISQTTAPAPSVSGSQSGANQTNLALGLGLGLGSPISVLLSIASAWAIRELKRRLTAHAISRAETISHRENRSQELEAAGRQQSIRNLAAELHAVGELDSQSINEAGDADVRHELRASALTRTLSLLSSFWSKRSSDLAPETESVTDWKRHLV